MSDIETQALLKQSTNEDLAPLVEYIVKKGGVTQTLTKTESYQRYQPDHQRYVAEIYREIRQFGGNSIANVFRPEGVPYEKVVRDVAKHLKAKPQADDRIAEVEERIIGKIVADALKKATSKDREAAEEALRKAGLDARDLTGLLSGGALAGTVAGSVAMYQLSTLAAGAAAKQLLGHGLAVAGNAVVGRALGVLTGPVGWVITGAWTAFDISGPAYRVTVPCVIHIAMLRQKYLHQQRALSGAESEAFADE